VTVRPPPKKSAGRQQAGSQGQVAQGRGHIERVNDLLAADLPVSEAGHHDKIIVEVQLGVQRGVILFVPADAGVDHIGQPGEPIDQPRPGQAAGGVAVITR
jgi:hypothetical protein